MKKLAVKTKAIYSAFLFLVALTSCYTPQEGCMDASAVNYDVKADINCCCQYPALKLNFTYRYDTLNFSQSTIYHDVAERPYKVENFQLNFHNIMLVNEDGESLVFQDTFKHDRGESHSSLNRRIDLFNRVISTGKIDVEQVYTELSMTAGVGDDIRALDIDEIRSNRELVNNLKEVYYGQKWYDGYLEYVPDTSKLDSVHRTRFHVKDKELHIQENFIPKYGENLSISLQMDLSKVLKDFEVAADSTTQAEQLSSYWITSIVLDTL